MKQHLILRGSRDFESLEDYEAFLGQVMDKRNGTRQKRLADELAVMKPLPVAIPLTPIQSLKNKKSPATQTTPMVMACPTRTRAMCTVPIRSTATPTTTVSPTTTKRLPAPIRSTNAPRVRQRARARLRPAGA